MSIYHTYNFDNLQHEKQSIILKNISNYNLIYKLHLISYFRTSDQFKKAKNNTAFSSMIDLSSTK